MAQIVLAWPDRESARESGWKRNDIVGIFRSNEALGFAIDLNVAGGPLAPGAQHRIIDTPGTIAQVVQAIYNEMVSRGDIVTITRPQLRGAVSRLFRFRTPALAGPKRADLRMPADGGSGSGRTEVRRNALANLLRWKTGRDEAWFLAEEAKRYV